MVLNIDMVNKMSWKDILKTLTPYEQSVADEFGDDEDMQKPDYKLPEELEEAADTSWMNEFMQQPKNKTAGQKSFIARAKKNLEEEKRKGN